MVYRWKPRYFILKNGILTYCDKKGDAPKGKIHLKISEIDLSAEDPLKVIINSGTKTLELRANSIGDKIKWLNALRTSKEEILKKDSEYNKLKRNFNSESLSEFFQKYKSEENLEKKKDFLPNFKQVLTAKMNEIWSEQMRFDDTLQKLIHKLGPNSSVADLLSSLEQIGSSLIVRFF